MEGERQMKQRHAFPAKAILYQPVPSQHSTSPYLHKWAQLADQVSLTYISITAYLIPAQIAAPQNCELNKWLLF